MVEASTNARSCLLVGNYTSKVTSIGDFLIKFFPKVYLKKQEAQ